MSKKKKKKIKQQLKANLAQTQRNAIVRKGIPAHPPIPLFEAPPPPLTQLALPF